MKDERKTKKQLIAELTELRQQVAELEAAEAKRSRAKRTLQTRTEQYRSLFDGIPVGLYRSTPDGRILHANPALAQMLGYPDIKTLKTINAAQVYVNPEERKRWQALMAREGSVSGYELQWCRYDGTIIWVRDTAHAVRGARGQARYYEGVVEVITERKQAEEALRESEERFRLLCASAPIGIFLTDAAVQCIYANEHLQALAGLTFEECLGDGWTRVIHPDECEAVLEELEAAGKSCKFSREFRIVRPQGDLQWIHVRSAPIFSVTGNLIGRVGTVEDVTGRRQAEEALRESEERFRQFFENELDCCYMVSPEGIILDVNSATLEALGYSKKELVGKPLEMIYAPECLPKVEQRFAEWKETGQLKDEELIIVTKTGDRHTVLLSAGAVRDKDGKILHSVSVQRDIAERKHLEEQVRQQERLADVGQLAGGIAHDFNNVLTTIMLYAQMGLIKDDRSADVARAFETILDESQQATELVQRILDFSRRSAMETLPVDLVFCADKAADILRRTLPENIRLLLEVEEEEYIVNGDPTRIQQVLMNLALNARDAMPEGGDLRIGLSLIEVGADEESPVANMPPGEWVCLIVSDTGIGMTEEVRTHLFEPFFTTKTRGEGTGLGLAQVYGIVKQHEGYIGVETEVGRGTTVRVYLPAIKTEEADKTEGKTPSPPKGKGETILLVEDKKGLLTAGQEILESLGYRVLAAADGREALEMYRSAEESRSAQGRGVDLVLTDVVMPEMGGKELIQELRKIDPNVRALAITGHALTESVEELGEAGIPEVVKKPLGMHALAQAVRQALD